MVGTNLLGNLLTEKGTIRAGQGLARADKGRIKTVQDF